MLLRKVKSIFILSLTMVVVGLANYNVLLVLAADNDATQEASTSQATTISIVRKVNDTAVSTITFPQGSPGATVSDPYNSGDGSGDSQVLDPDNSEPVVRLKNTSGGTLQVTLEITSWTDAVDAEYYEIIDTTTTNVESVEQVLSADGTAAIVDTGATISNGAYKAIYLAIDLSADAGKSGTSTIAVLGETP
jgi:hypothetical protein